MKVSSFAVVLAACGSAVVLAACGSAPASSGPEIARPLLFERWSLAQPSSYDVFLAARGSIVVTAKRISRDGGTTWTALDPGLGIGQLGVLELHGDTVMLYAPQRGLVRWNPATDQIVPSAGAPAFAGERTWRRDPATGRFLAFDPIENAVAIEQPGGWMISALPRPAPTECCPYITDVESNGATMLAVSGWGVHRSGDGGATWRLALADIEDAGRDLLVLGDGRFALVGGPVSYLFDAAGEAAGTAADLVVGNDEAIVCDDGSIVISGRGTSSRPDAGAATGHVTRDLGATWQPLASAGDLELDVERAGCGAGSYWVLLHSASWGYRLVRHPAPGAPGVAAGNWDAFGPQAWTTGGPSIIRADDGTFLTGGLAWHDGDAAWTLREMPGRTWSSGGVLFGAAGGRFYLSRDTGLEWTALAAAGLTATDPDAFARTPDGTLYVGQFAGQSTAEIDTWRSTVWRSTDHGASWTIAHEGLATRPAGEDITGEAHRFVGITAEGAWIATGAVSLDGGATWQRTHASGDRSKAHLMPDGSLVMQPADASGEIWRVYADGGRGELLATHAIEADGEPVLAAELRSVAFDDEGHAYVARGTPHIQIWRSTTPLQQPTGTR
jgi:hypothetical protein